MPVDISVLTTLEATSALDNFNYIANPISTGTPSGGGTWTDRVLSGESDLQTDGTSLKVSAFNSDCTAYHSSSWNSDMGGMLTVTSKVSTDDGLVGIHIALQGAGLGTGFPNGYRGEIRIRTTGDEWRIQRIDVGIPTPISSGTIQEVSTGDKFAIVRNGNDIELWWKSIGTGTWSFIVSATDATYSSGGKVGVHVNDQGSPDSTEDDLKVMNLSVVGVSQAPSPGIVRVRMRAY